MKAQHGVVAGARCSPGSPQQVCPHRMARDSLSTQQYLPGMSLSGKWGPGGPRCWHFLILTTWLASHGGLQHCFSG